MLADVTQSLHIRIIPVNNPAEGGADSGYRAIVTHDYNALIQASTQTYTGKEPTNVLVGFGQSRTARYAALNALDDYAEKFGTLCVVDTDKEFDLPQA
jgi:hypothetical protein